LGIPFEVYGPEVHMTKIVKLALEWVNVTPHNHSQENGKHENGKVIHENGKPAIHENGKVFENGQQHAIGVGVGH